MILKNIGQNVSSFKRIFLVNAISIDSVEDVTKFHRKDIGNTLYLYFDNAFLRVPINDYNNTTLIK